MFSEADYDEADEGSAYYDDLYTYFEDWLDENGIESQDLSTAEEAKLWALFMEPKRRAPALSDYCMSKRDFY